MKKTGALLLLLAVAVMLCASPSHAADGYKYATTNMTFAEFYAGETGAASADLLSQGLDAISTPTTHGLARFPLLLGESGDNGTTITGLKAVQVRMSDTVYDALSNDSRYTFTDETFTEYKNVNADGSFGAMVSETTTPESAKVSFASGASATWGHYVLSVASADITIGSANRYCDYYLGALLETSAGNIYGMRHDNNLWSNTDIAFTVNDNFTEIHGTGVKRFPEYTKDLPGQTITKITYMLKGLPDVVLDGLNIYVKELTSASVTPESSSVKSGSNIAVKFTFSDVPDGATYTASSAYSGNGRTRQAVTDFTYSDGAVTFASLSAGSYTVIFSSELYADISASFTVTDYYATTDMTFAEFYAGETGKTSATLKSEGLDAISTPTTHGLARFPLLLGESGDNGTTITGFKAVQVRMTGDVYNAITDKSRYTFTDDSFSEYKLASSDGSFGAMVSETTTATSADVTIATGSSARWGHYVFSVSGASIDIGTSGDKIARNYQGALLETTDGKIYGMRHDNNLWSNTDIAFTVNENYVEPHGVGTKRFPEYTKNLEGATVKKITYMLKGLPDVVIDSLDLYIKKQTSASVKPESDYLPGANVPMRLIFSDIPDGVTYDLVGVSSGTGRNSKAISDYTYENNILTITGNITPGTYTATFRTGEYVDISAKITVTDYFATTDMTWAEFYAGETGKTADTLKSAGLDAVSSPTARVANRFTQLTSESNDIGGRDITGVKAVRVSMTQNVYNLLSNDSRYTFSDEIFTQYKPVSSDGSFGAMVAESKDISGASVALSSGASSTWGSYMLTITSLDLTLSSGDENYYLGGLAETSDGEIYGLRHNTNLWFSAGNIAFTVNGNYSEPHGVSRDYAYTSDLEGKTITKITYLLKDQPKAVLSCDVYLKPLTSATVSAPSGLTAGNNVPIAFTFNGLPTGTTYTLTSLYSGTGRGRTPITDYTYENNTLTVNGTLPGGTYRAIFSTDDYADIGVTFTVEDTYHYATTNMTWAEFYAGALGESSSDLYTAGLDAISSPTARVANRFSQLTSESNDIGGRDITGVKAVQVRMPYAVYLALSDDTRYTFSDESFAEYKEVNADGTFGAMVTETHTQEGATVSLTAPGTWGDYVLAVNSIDITVSSGDEYYYLGAIVETSDGKKYGMRHNNNLWFNAKDLAISTAEFVEVHGVSRKYAYTSDMEGKTITKITYMLKNLPDEIISCDVFLKLKTSASVAPVYETGYHAVMAGVDLPVTLSFDDVPSSADYQLSAVYYGTGRGRKAVEGCTMSGDILIIAGETQEGTYTATFTDETYANITATIRIFTTNATDKIISADKNKAGLMFLLTPAGVSDSTDAVLDAQNFFNATDYTVIAENMTDNYTGAANMIQDSGFTLNVQLDGFPAGKHGILGFSKNLQITPAKIGDNDFSAMASKILALPDVAYGWRVPTVAQLKDMGLTVTAVYSDGVSRDVTGYISSGLYVGNNAITFSYGTVLIDREFTPSEEGKVYALSDEGEGTMSDGAFDGKISATWYVSLPGGSAGGDGYNPASDDTRPTPASDDTRPTPTPGGDTPSTTAPTTAPGKSAITLTDSKKSDIAQRLSKLSSKVTSSTEITELPASAIKSTRNATSSDNTIYISDIEVSESKVYVFGVSLDKFAVGSPIYWNSNATDTSTGAFVSAAESEEAVMFMNDDGEEVTTVPANKHVNVAAYLEAGKTYSPTITTVKDSGTDTGNQQTIGSSGGGCEVFGGMIAAMLAGLLMIAYRKQR